jgi:hypothetical protein
MSECIFKYLHTGINPKFEETMIDSCRLFRQPICLGCCMRIEQTINAVFGQITSRTITPEQFLNDPKIVRGLIDDKLVPFFDILVERDFSETKSICAYCRTQPQGSPIVEYPKAKKTSLQYVEK